MAPKPKLPTATAEQFEGHTLMRMVTRNVKRVKYVDITLQDGTMTVIGGDNDQGKSSFLDSYGFCMGGKAAINGAGGKLPITMGPIRNGQQEGSVQCDFGDGQKVTLSVIRTLKRLGESEFTADVDVEIPGHVPPKSIETFLRNLTNEYAFDPMAFDEMNAEQQFEALQKLVGNFDFKAHAAKHKTVYDERTVVGRDYERENSAAEAMVVPTDPPCELIDEDALTRELQEAGQKNTERAIRASNREKAVTKIAGLRDVAAQVDERIATARNQAEAARDKEIARLQEAIERARLDCEQAIQTESESHRAEAAAAIAEADSLQKRLDEAGPLPEETDTDAITARLQAARLNNARYVTWTQQRDRRKEHVDKANGHALNYDQLTKRLDELDAERLKVIEDAKLPVEGIGFGDGYVTLKAEDGAGTVPWAQASEAIRTDASLSLAMAMQPKLKVILIRNGSNIGKRIRQRIQQRAAERKYKVVLEVVEEGDGTHVVIEDGQVKAARQPEGAGLATPQGGQPS